MSEKEMKDNQRERLQVKVGGMSCSFCTATIEKAYKHMDGVEGAHVSLTHEEALIEYDRRGTPPPSCATCCAVWATQCAIRTRSRPTKSSRRSCAGKSAA